MYLRGNRPEHPGGFLAFQAPKRSDITQIAKKGISAAGSSQGRIRFLNSPVAVVGAGVENKDRILHAEQIDAVIQVEAARVVQGEAVAYQKVSLHRAGHVAYELDAVIAVGDEVVQQMGIVGGNVNSIIKIENLIAENISPCGRSGRIEISALISQEYYSSSAQACPILELFRDYIGQHDGNSAMKLLWISGRLPRLIGQIQAHGSLRPTRPNIRSFHLSPKRGLPEYVQ